MFRSVVPAASPVLMLMLSAGHLSAQFTPADYARAIDLRKHNAALVVDHPGEVHWFDASIQTSSKEDPAAAKPPEANANTPTLGWFTLSLPAGHRFVLLNATARTTSPLFDHPMLAAALNSTSGAKYTAETMPLDSITFANFNEPLRTMRFDIENDYFTDHWTCTLAAIYTCAKQPIDPVRVAWAADHPMEDSDEPMNDRRNSLVMAKASPDGKLEALVVNDNVAVRDKSNGKLIALSTDGSEGNYYTLESLVWSPDSNSLAVYRIRPGQRREIHYIRSSPEDQLQPEYSTIHYDKPGDVLDLQQPVLFNVVTHAETILDNSLFPNPYNLTPIQWWKDSRAFTFEYNQRGHQVYRVLEANAASGAVRALISEETPTFFFDRPLRPDNEDAGRYFRHDIADGNEIVWMSERDGWAHLYLFDGKIGALKNQITHGDWVVRGVEWVDESKRQIWFDASGTAAGRDPYFLSLWRIDFDGTGLTEISGSDADHHYSFSQDHRFFTDTESRIDRPAVVTLHQVSDAATVMTVAREDASKLFASGWTPPESFHAKGRDGVTDIWGIIYRPAPFDPKRKYPVLENIYAGPHGSFVPKSFSALSEPLTGFGFIVVKIDGMGTANRSKKFHDVIWKNLQDAGFADRILWHKAVAAQYSWYDLSRVGIYGTSAGGQSAMGAMLFHPEFYKAAVSNSGCHDNRMDKISWNEQWMGWPIGPQYAAASNVDNAFRLRGKLFLIVGEMDTNVDPSSTYQVVNALNKAHKQYDLMVVPNAGHGTGGLNSMRPFYDFFLHAFQPEVATPDWNSLANADKDSQNP